MSDPARGFTLVEVLMAALVMLLSAIGGSNLVNQSTRQVGGITARLHEQYAISRDLASILETNERYTCVDLIADGVCRITQADQPGEASPPDQDHYAPPLVDGRQSSTTPSFGELCEQGLLTSLLGSLGANQPNGTLLNTGYADITLRRFVSVDPASRSAETVSIRPHRYLVSWKNGQDKLLRQVQLTPTVAAWCP